MAVLGRIPELSRAELVAQFGKVEVASEFLATFEADSVNIDRLGGTMKVGSLLNGSLLRFLQELPEGKITLGVSDYRKGASARRAQGEAVKLKKMLAKKGRSVRVVPNKGAELSTAAVLHNGLGRKPRAVEVMLTPAGTFIGAGVQNIDAYARRDQARPARDAKVGMLPPKLAQILINLCGPLKPGARVLDPFCGTGVVLQEASLMGYTPYGTDASERMVKYSERNLKWLGCEDFKVEVGDATNFKWTGPVDAVAGETYLGPPMSQVPGEMKLKAAKEECREIIFGFLKNLAKQIPAGTPVTLAIPAWRRANGEYERLGGLDEIEKMGYNGSKELGFGGLLYYREGQVVAREIIVLRKK